jgi:hypothetical protein
MDWDHHSGQSFVKTTGCAVYRSKRQVREVPHESYFPDHFKLPSMLEGLCPQRGNISVGVVFA